jgi:hypothetical protein
LIIWGVTVRGKIVEHTLMEERKMEKKWEEGVRRWS